MTTEYNLCVNAEKSDGTQPGRFDVCLDLMDEHIDGGLSALTESSDQSVRKE